MPYLHRLKVRYAETDQMGVVHHANHLVYLEEARTEYMASLGAPYGTIEATGIALPVRRVDLRYRAPSRFGDELEISVAVGRLRAASVRFDYSIRRPADGATLLDGTVELACVSLTDRTPAMLPEGLRAQLEAQTDPASS